MRHWLVLAALGSISALASCGGGGGGGGAPPTLSGEVQFVPVTVPLTLVSNSPSVSHAGPRLELRAGTPMRLRGELVGGRDVVRLRSGERVAVTATLGGAPGARLALHDPLSLSVATPGRTQRFLARGSADLIVRGDDGPWELELAVLPVGSVPLDGNLGAFLVGDELALEAGASARAELACAESLDLVVRAQAGLTVLDGDGNAVARIEPTGGELRLEGAPLSRFTLFSDAGVRQSISLSAQAPAAPRAWARVASAEAERAAFGLDPQASLATAVEAEFVPGELLVRARAGADLAPGIARRLGRVDQRIPETSDLVSVPLEESLSGSEVARMTLAAIGAFEASPDVEWAEPNFIRRRLEVAGGATVTPNDTFYGLQWHYDLIKLPQAWAMAIGDPNVIIAIVDTGSRPHPDLDGNTIAGFDFISSAANAGDGNGIDPDPLDVGDGDALSPSSFHGTHVAGTVGAVSNNNAGVAGVNWNCSLMHLRVLGLQGGTDADIAQALRYAARLSNSSNTLPTARANVINLSLGGPSFNSTMQSTITAVRNAGCVVIAAAGNSNSSELFYPASYNGVISVSAVDINGAKAPYSNFGTAVDVAAPGGDVSRDLNSDGYVDGVLSTLVDENNGFSPNFVFYQGTSMACPHVAGLAALLLDVDPTLTVSEIETILTTTTIDLGAPGRDDIFGHGLVQADRALLAAAGTTPPTPVLSVTPLSLEFGPTATLLTIQVSNSGGGSLDVGNPTFTPIGAPWTATLNVIASTGASDVSAIEVSVDRTGLAAATYTGTISIPSNGGNATVAVSMSVVNATPPEDVDLFVVLVDLADPQNPLVVAQTVVNPTTGLAWQMLDDGFGEPIPAGDYVLLCGSDDDNDGFIFEPEDVYTGGWPSLNELLEFPLSNGDELTGLDFPVTGSPSTLAGSRDPRLPGTGLRLRTEPR